MQTILGAVRSGGVAAMPQVLVARSVTSNPNIDAVEIPAFTLPLANGDAGTRVILCIELHGADTVIEEGEVWDVFAHGRLTNPNSSNTTPNPVTWHTEVRLDTDDNHDRGGDVLIAASRTLRVTRNPDPDNAGGSLHHAMIYRRSQFTFVEGYPQVASRFVKFLYFAGPASSEDITAHDFGLFRVERHKPGQMVIK